MDCITTIQKAIQYIEDNLLEDINYDDIAEQVYILTFAIKIKNKGLKQSDNNAFRLLILVIKLLCNISFFGFS